MTNYIGLNVPRFLRLSKLATKLVQVTCHFSFNVSNALRLPVATTQSPPNLLKLVGNRFTENLAAIA
jgi:hypothetical protein